MLLSFVVKFVQYLSCEKNENKQKEAGLAHLEKNICKFIHSQVHSATCVPRSDFILSCPVYPCQILSYSCQILANLCPTLLSQNPVLYFPCPVLEKT